MDTSRWLEGESSSLEAAPGTRHHHGRAGVAGGVRLQLRSLSYVAGARLLQFKAGRGGEVTGAEGAGAEAEGAAGEPPIWKEPVAPDAPAGLPTGRNGRPRERLQEAVKANNNRWLALLEPFQEARRVPSNHRSPSRKWTPTLVQYLVQFQQDAGALAAAKGTKRQLNAGRAKQLLTGVWSDELVAVFEANYGKSTNERTESDNEVPPEGQLNASKLWPRVDASVDEQYQHWSNLALLFGHKVQDGKTTLIGIRGVMVLAKFTHLSKHVPAYDDTFVKLDVVDGKKLVKVFSGGTHATNTRPTEAVDVDGKDGQESGAIRTKDTNDGTRMYNLKAKDNGKKGPRMYVSANIEEWMPAADKPGNENKSQERGTKAKKRRRGKKKPHWGAGTVAIDRDTNHDGIISADEATASRTRKRGKQVSRYGTGDYATGVLFHRGYTEGSASIACQTAREGDVADLRSRTLEQRNRGEGVAYLLIQAKDAVKKLGDAGDKTTPDEPRAQPKPSADDGAKGASAPPGGGAGSGPGGAKPTSPAPAKAQSAPAPAPAAEATPGGEAAGAAAASAHDASDAEGGGAPGRILSEAKAMEATDFNRDRSAWGRRPKRWAALEQFLGLAPDGTIDDESSEALARFQKKNGLVPDGKAGPKTRRKVTRLMPRDTSEQSGVAAKGEPSAAGDEHLA